MKKLIFCFDIDNTLCVSHGGNYKKSAPIKKNIRLVNYLIKKYDGEFPDNYFSDTMKYLGINENFFIKLCERFRSPHLWKKIKNKWHLRHTCNKDGTDD